MQTATEALILIQLFLLVLLASSLHPPSNPVAYQLVPWTNGSKTVKFVCMVVTVVFSIHGIIAHRMQETIKNMVWGNAFIGRQFVPNFPLCRFDIRPHDQKQDHCLDNLLNRCQTYIQIGCHAFLSHPTVSHQDLQFVSLHLVQCGSCAVAWPVHRAPRFYPARDLAQRGERHTIFLPSSSSSSRRRLAAR